MIPPEAPQTPYEHTEHGVTRPDPYHWMGSTTPALLDHLSAERSFYDTSVAHLHPLVSALTAEMSSRLPETEVSAPWRRSRFSYYTEYVSGSDYPRIMREIVGSDTDSIQISPNRAGMHDGSRGDSPQSTESSGAPEPEVVLDAASLVGESGYLELGLTIVSPDEDLLAWSVDHTGDEVYTLRFRDLHTGEDLDEVVPRSYYSGAWSADSQWFFYTVHDELYRPHQVWRHRIGTPATDDVMVLHEPDARFELSVRATRSGDLVLMKAESRDTAETWVVDAHDPTAKPRSAGGRRPGVIYRAEHVRGQDGGELLLVTDDDAVEFRLVAAPVPRDGDQDHTTWREVRPGRDDERLEQVDAFAGHVVLSLRTGGEHVLRIVPVGDYAGEGILVRSRFPHGTVHLGRNVAHDPAAVTVVEQTEVQPPVWLSVDLATGAATEVLRREAPGHDPSAYVSERRTFPSADGTPVPATILRHRDVPLDGTAPALIYAYGAYEATDDPVWDPALPSLLDRGVVYVHAHVRGGGEMGRRWWLDGRMQHKQHTFDDLVAVADGLAEGGLVDGSRIATRGLSAGGLLQGAVFSQRPDRWRAVVAEVPFVDVVTTMLDPDTPLTVNEWEEWGDPRRREEFEWMLAYSPYDNIPPAGGRPDLLVTGAVHDPRVMVREPAKWVAALRASDPEWSPRCVFRCELGAGSHVGPSGRFGHLAYEAEVHAWVLDRLGLVDSGSVGAGTGAAS
ncbi:prolyl oligopeptidase family serine peptidase [Nocardioides sp. GCM10027113]|uniref:prolyl oligopeptidase family serine peptidase n=1 Tax=unclassified Nocardioides TaxID=2615069 RepID=UPI003609ECEF